MHLFIYTLAFFQKNLKQLQWKEPGVVLFNMADTSHTGCWFAWRRCQCSSTEMRCVVCATHTLHSKYFCKISYEWFSILIMHWESILDIYWVDWIWLKLISKVSFFSVAIRKLKIIQVACICSSHDISIGQHWSRTQLVHKEMMTRST